MPEMLSAACPKPPRQGFLEQGRNPGTRGSLRATRAGFGKSQGCGFLAIQGWWDVLWATSEGSMETKWRWSWGHEGLGDGWPCWLGWNFQCDLGRPVRHRQRSKVTACVCSSTSWYLRPTPASMPLAPWSSLQGMPLPSPQPRWVILTLRAPNPSALFGWIPPQAQADQPRLQGYFGCTIVGSCPCPTMSRDSSCSRPQQHWTRAGSPARGQPLLFSCVVPTQGLF